MFDSLLCFCRFFIFGYFETISVFGKNALDIYYSVSQVLLRPLGGVIFMTVSFYYSVYPLSLCDKNGE
jgi:hypothetical protein